MTSTSRRSAFLPGSLTPLAAAIGLSLLATSAVAADDIPDLSGIWQFGSCGGGGFNLGCMVLEEDDERLTERAKAYRDVIDEAAQPKYDCAPMSIPHMWTDPYAYRVEQLDDRVLIHYGKDDVVRTVWLEGHGHDEPAVNEFFYFGHATGRYEDGALVVITDRFTFDPQGLNADFRIPSSTQKQVTERFSRAGENLVLEVSTIDTFFLKQPWSFRVTSEPFVGEWDESWQCDLEGARHSLKLMAPMYPEDPQIERIDY
jgi:hypothetical protein